MKKPIIGVTLDFETTPTYSIMPWYALRENYCTPIHDAGGAPIALPHICAAGESYMDIIDGLLITGGGFDIDPALYGVRDVHETTAPKHARTQFEMTLARLCLARNKPVFGICGGMQLINVVCGGTLIQDIPSLYPSDTPHTQKPPFTQSIHDVHISRGTHMHNILTGTDGDASVENLSFGVNSYHHQAVKDVGENIRVCATAPDGIIEAVEHTDHPFFMGVQWHPEYYVQNYDALLFKSFVASCRDASR